VSTQSSEPAAAGFPLPTTDVDSFAEDVLRAAGPVLVDFWAPWCPPCRISTPILAELAEEFVGQLQVVGLNTDQNPQIAQIYQIASIPSFALFIDGELRNLWVGARSKASLRADISAAVTGL